MGFVDTNTIPNSTKNTLSRGHINEAQQGMEKICCSVHSVSWRCSHGVSLQIYNISLWKEKV